MATKAMINPGVRKVRVGEFATKYYETNSVFPSMAYKFRPLPVLKQILDVEHFSTCSNKKFSEEEICLTESFRSKMKYYSRIFNMEKLRQRPMLSMESGSALMLPLDNELGLDYLTYTHPLYHKFIVDLCDELIKVDASPEVVDCLKVLMVDYSFWTPFNSSIRHDGMLRVDSSRWKDENILSFQRTLGPFLLKAFEMAGSHLGDYLPKINSTKSCGWNTRNPDGTPMNKRDYEFLPESWRGDDNFESARLIGAARYNFSPFKYSWISSGRVQDNLDFFLARCDEYRNPKILNEAFLREAASIHVEAFRTNNADVPKNEIKTSFSELLDTGFKKDRDFSVEREPFVWTSGVMKDAEWQNAFREKNPQHRLCALKKRSMFPAPNASFSPPFIFLFRTMLHEVEDGATGFPSNRPCVYDRFKRVFTKYAGEPVHFITFDRRTAEQFISDNWDKVLKFFFPALAKIIDGLSISILPSAQGVRVCPGGLCSGTAQTTFINSITGMFEMVNVVCHVENLPFEEVCPIVLDAIFNQKDDVRIGKRRYLFSLGTDDQIVTVFGPKPVVSDEFWTTASLSGEVTTEATVFGMHFTPAGVEVSQSLGLGKLFLLEKTVHGDAAATKMACRIEALPKFYDAIQRVFSKYKFGSLESYKVGRKSYLNNVIAAFGYSIDPLMNEYNPTEKLIYGSLLTEDMVKKSQKFTESDVRPWYNSFKKFFGI